MNTWKVHKESWNIRNWFRYETFICLFEFKVFRHEERETQFLSMLIFPSNSITCSTFRRPQLANIDFLLLASNLNLLSFFKCQNPQPRFQAWRHSRPRSYFLSGVFIVTSCVNTCTQCVHLTNSCTKRKVLSLTKLKGKIYKTKNDNIKKSLRNYITFRTYRMFVCYPTKVKCGTIYQS